MEPSLGRHKLLKVVRWAQYLSEFDYRIEHVPEGMNTWPDIMTRWMRSYRRNSTLRRMKRCELYDGIPHSSKSSELVWPSTAEIL